MVRRPLIATPHLGTYNVYDVLEPRSAVEGRFALNGG